jgi:sugar phosphate isomerase/epimerase
MRVLYSTGNLYRTHNLRESEEMLLSLGYFGMELMLPPVNRESVKERDTDYGSVSSVKVIHARSDFFDGDRFKASLDNAVEVGKMISVDKINIHPASKALGGRENVVRTIEYIRLVEEKAKMDIFYELLVNPEGVSKEGQAWFKRQAPYESIDEYISDVKEFDLKATLDVCHIGTWGTDTVEVIELVGDTLAHVHLSDYDKTTREEHVQLGDGDLEIASVVQKLHETKPDLTVTIELFSSESRDKNEAMAKKSIEYINGLIG